MMTSKRIELRFSFFSPSEQICTHFFNSYNSANFRARSSRFCTVVIGTFSEPQAGSNLNDDGNFWNCWHVGNFRNVGNVRNVVNIRRYKETSSVLHFRNHKLKLI